jgi:hypothetical protein
MSILKLVMPPVGVSLKVGLHDAWNRALYRARSEHADGACVRSDKERASMSMLAADPISWAKIQNQAVFDFPCSEQDVGACLSSVCSVFSYGAAVEWWLNTVVLKLWGATPRGAQHTFLQIKIKTALNKLEK